MAVCMDEILKRLGLENVVQNFRNENITPDLVGQLSAELPLSCEKAVF